MMEITFMEKYKCFALSPTLASFPSTALSYSYIEVLLLRLYLCNFIKRRGDDNCYVCLGYWSGRTLPGFMMFMGSIVALIARINDNFVGSANLHSDDCFSVPMPCSAENEPPIALSPV
jgi:hypothetical protein